MPITARIVKEYTASCCYCNKKLKDILDKEVAYPDKEDLIDVAYTCYEWDYNENTGLMSCPTCLYE